MAQRSKPHFKLFRCGDFMNWFCHELQIYCYPRQGQPPKYQIWKDGAIKGYDDLTKIMRIVK